MWEEQQQQCLFHTLIEQEQQITNGTAIQRTTRLAEQPFQEQLLIPTHHQVQPLEQLIIIA